MPRLASVPLNNTGLEFAQMYRRFGSEVTVIELARAHIMPRHVRSDLGKPLFQALCHAIKIVRMASRRRRSPRPPGGGRNRRHPGL